MSRPLSGPEGKAARQRLAGAAHPVLFLDLDGTLAPFVKSPPAARIPASTARALRQLRRSGARVVLVSGRRPERARQVAGMNLDGIIGNHGADLLRGGQTRAWLGGDEARMARVAHRIDAVLQRDRRHATVEFKGRSIAVHHHLRGEARRALFDHVSMALHDHRVVALPGRRVVDVRFRRVDKGLAILRWIGRAGARREDVLYAGDDTTDEDAFRALRAPSVTIAVGPGPKAAGFRTSGPPALSRWLRRLAEARR